MNMAELVFLRESHEYFYEGRKVPSVTQLLKPLYEGAFDGIPEHILNAKRDIGTAVHLACELHDCDELLESSIHPIVRPYLDGWKRFVDDHARHGFIALEYRRYHPTLGFAGTVDRELFLQDCPTTLDIKTTVDMHPAVGVQLAAYAMLADPVHHRAHRRIAVQLTGDGLYQLHEYKGPSDAACFLSLLTLHNWKAKNK